MFSHFAEALLSMKIKNAGPEFHLQCFGVQVVKTLFSPCSAIPWHTHATWNTEVTYCPPIMPKNIGPLFSYRFLASFSKPYSSHGLTFLWLWFFFSREEILDRQVDISPMFPRAYLAIQLLIMPIFVIFLLCLTVIGTWDESCSHWCGQPDLNCPEDLRHMV